MLNIDSNCHRPAFFLRKNCLIIIKSFSLTDFINLITRSFFIQGLTSHSEISSSYFSSLTNLSTVTSFNKTLKLLE